MMPQAPFGVRVEYDVPATMRDGTVLRANVYRPDDGGAGSYPVLLTRLPYGKDLPLGHSVLEPGQAARRGYVVVVQDARGTFTSDGEWFPLVHEGPDGADTVAWAATLPGSNGSVAMYGVSYFGHTQLAAAAQHPPALRALAPMMTWADADDPTAGILTRNGVLELGAQGGWNLEMGLDQLVRRHRGDPETLGKAVYGLVREIDNLPRGGYAELPLDRFGPLARMDLEAPLYSSIHNRHDATYTQQARISNAYALGVPALHIGGWYDIFLNGTLRNFAAMRDNGGAAQYLLIGPWTHGNVNRAQGDLDFGFASSGALMDLRIDLMSQQLQFFDRWLKDAQNGFDTHPAVKYFVMGANIWKSSDTWPPAESEPQEWYLHSQGRANSAAGDGVLSRERPSDESADVYMYDPEQPVPTIGGATMLPSILRPGPRDQRSIEQRHDVLVYTSAPLDQPLEVVGPVSVMLYVASDAPDTDFVARLVDVYPDGSAITVTDGVMRMSHREGPDAVVPPLEPSQVYAIGVDLWSTGLMFLPGHRVRLDVTSSSFPRWERNLNTGENSATSTEMRMARQSVLHNAGHPSRVVLSAIAR